MSIIVIFVIWVVSVLMVLLAVAFLTLFERHALRAIQIRRGPNKVGEFGLLQPMVDGVKLFAKGFISTYRGNVFLFFFGAVLTFFIMIILWAAIVNGRFLQFRGISYLGVLIFLGVAGLKTYAILIMGWARKSKYAFIGAVRGGVQTISFEIALLFFVLTPAIFIGRYGFSVYRWVIYPLIFPLLWVAICWVPLCLAEANRAPFDFAEGERELVRGFNVEYGGIGFSLLFLGEYGRILGFCWISGVLFGGGVGYIIIPIIMAILFIFIRGLLPRYRIDLLIFLFWCGLMPVGILSVLVFLFF